MEIKIQSLHIYPLKGAKGISLKTMDIVKTGPQWDRKWMLIDKENDFISQRKSSKLCLLEQEITDNHLVLKAPMMENLEIPLINEHKDLTEITLFKKNTTACLVGNFFDEWLSTFLESEVRLVVSPQEPSRFTSGNHGPKTEILFPDGYPFLLTAQETLDELNAKLDEPVTMSRFRPNIVISGANANDEESWKSFKIGNINFDSAKACTRCVVISIDQETGKKNNDIVRTLNSYRKKDGSIIFGRNLMHDSSGSINVGDTLQVN